MKKIDRRPGSSCTQRCASKHRRRRFGTCVDRVRVGGYGVRCKVEVGLSPGRQAYIDNRSLGAVNRVPGPYGRRNPLWNSDLVQPILDTDPMYRQAGPSQTQSGQGHDRNRSATIPTKPTTPNTIPHPIPRNGPSTPSYTLYRIPARGCGPLHPSSHPVPRERSILAPTLPQSSLPHRAQQVRHSTQSALTLHIVHDLSDLWEVLAHDHVMLLGPPCELGSHRLLRVRQTRRVAHGLW